MTHEHAILGASLGGNDDAACALDPLSGSGAVLARPELFAWVRREEGLPPAARETLRGWRG